MLLWGPMTVHDVLTHPLCWIVLAICIVAGIYVKRRVGKGLVFGIAAPLFLVPTWAVVSFCRSAREVDGLKPAGQAPGRGISAGASHNPFRKRIL